MKSGPAAWPQAGCKIVKFGVESGSQRIRSQILQRRMTNEKIIRAIDTAHRHGLHTSVFLMIGLPDETHDDVMATIKLMAQAKPGRYRWSFFFPFPGTKAYELSQQGDYIDFDKMANLENFTDASCLKFGKDHDLFLKKVGRVMPWFVNAHSDLPVADFYRDKVEEILALDENAWQARVPQLEQEDREIIGKNSSTRDSVTMPSNTTALWGSYPIISSPKNNDRNGYSGKSSGELDCRLTDAGRCNWQGASWISAQTVNGWPQPIRPVSPCIRSQLELSSRPREKLPVEG